MLNSSSLGSSLSKARHSTYNISAINTFGIRITFREYGFILLKLKGIILVLILAVLGILLSKISMIDVY